MRIMLLGWIAGLLLFLTGCEPRRVEVPYSFLDSLTFPYDSALVFHPEMARTFTVTRSEGESVDLVLPAGGTQQNTWMHERNCLPTIDDEGCAVVESIEVGHDKEMVYHLDTLADGRYVMTAVGDGYGGRFMIDLTTE